MSASLTALFTAGSKVKAGLSMVPLPTDTRSCRRSVVMASVLPSGSVTVTATLFPAAVRVPPAFSAAWETAGTAMIKTNAVTKILIHFFTSASIC
jgi:hypothetical protein